MDIERFMQGYKAAWEGRDKALFCQLFAKDGLYHNTPFAVQRGHEQLAAYWHRVELQEDVRLTYEVLASSPGAGIAHWHVTYQVASEELFRIWAASTGTHQIERKPRRSAAPHRARRRAAGALRGRSLPGVPPVVAQHAAGGLTKERCMPEIAIPPPKVLAFDVFGTVVDWHGSIAREVDAMKLGVSGNEFALAWRAGYQPAMRRVMAGELGWTLIDDLHRMILDELLAAVSHHRSRRSRQEAPEQGLAPAGSLARLRARPGPAEVALHDLHACPTATSACWPTWPSTAACPGTASCRPRCSAPTSPTRPPTWASRKVFDVAPHEVMLVAAHHDDLAGARACGLRTAYIERPLEFGAGQPKDVSPRPENELHAASLLALADLLGC